MSRGAIRYLAAAICVILLLSACSNERVADWRATAAHLNVTVTGPGMVTLSSGSAGEVSCRGDTINPHCYLEAAIAHGETVTVTATADAGHEFVSWLGHPGFGWTAQLAANQNPVQIVLDGDYQFYGNFQ